MIPEQRYVFDENIDAESQEMKDLKHMLELADLVAYESGGEDEDGEHVPPTYIGHHKADLSTDSKKRN